MTGATFSAAHYQEYQETGNKNLFEDVVEKMILEGVAGMNESAMKAIKNIPADKKRIAILRLLMESSSSHIQMFQKIKGLVNKDISRLEHIKDIIMLLRDYVKVGDVEQKKYGEVMTPLELVKEMLNKLPEKIWSDPGTKFLDCSNGTGVYPMVAIYKFMKGLEEWQPDEEKRYRHIVENMIYACELQPKNTFLYLCAIDPFDQYDINVYTGSYLDEGFDYHMKNVWGIDRVTVVSSNPPYQEELITKKGSAKPIYNLFTEKSIRISDYVMFITPSRWFAGGKGLDNFRKMMMGSRKVSLINHYPDAGVFWGGSVDIEGGVSYFLWDNSHNGDCAFNGEKVELGKYDIIYDLKFSSLIDKTFSEKNLSKICIGQSFSGINSNDVRLKTGMGDGDVKCYVSKVNGFTKFIPRNEVKKTANIDGWKVITAEANGSYPRFGNTFVGEPGSVCNQSYIVFNVETEEAAKSLVSYLKTKFANKLLSLRKISQHIKPDTCKWIPLVPLDRKWTDEQLFEYFNLSKEEIELICS